MKWRTEARGAAQWYNVLGMLGGPGVNPQHQKKGNQEMGRKGKMESEAGEEG